MRSHLRVSSAHTAQVKTGEILSEYGQSSLAVRGLTEQNAYGCQLNESCAYLFGNPRGGERDSTAEQERMRA